MTEAPLGAPRDRIAMAVAWIAGTALWRRALYATGSGAAAAFAFAPFYLLPAFVLAWSSLVLMLDEAAASQRPRARAFATGWFFGFGFHLVGLHWFAFAFLVQAELFAWMAPFAVVGMAAFLGLFFGAAAALANSFRQAGVRRILVLAAAMAAAEFLRGHILTGLPWNLPAQAMAGLAVTAQPVAWLGPYGYSLLVLVVAMLPAAFADGAPSFAGDRVAKLAAKKAGGLVLGATAAAFLYLGIVAIGWARLAFTPEPAPTKALVRIVQPNIPQREKINPDLWDRNIKTAIDLSVGGEKPAGQQRFILWPENAAPLLDEDEAALRAIGERFDQGDVLVAGAVRRGMDESGRWRVFNSILMVAVDGNAQPGRLTDYYDKHHLVPFGEYLPMQPLLKALGLSQLAPFDEGFTPGSGPARIELGGPAFAPLICYEAIFPNELYPRGERPDWLMTATNDAWFGDAAGPRQHLDQARFRSIETGLPMARAANTGISVLIDAKGRYLGRVDPYERGVIDAPLPGALPATVYARTGDWPAIALMVLTFLFGALKWRESAPAAPGN